MSGIGRVFADLELRNASAMRAAQDRWDNMAPPEPDDDRLTESEALEQAEAEALTTPIMPAEWLQQECFDALDPVDLHAMRGDDFDWRAVGLQECDGVTVAQLVAVMFGAHDSEVRGRALNELRDRFTAAQRDWMRERAAELLAEHAARDAEIAHFQEAA